MAVRPQPIDQNLPTAAAAMVSRAGRRLRCSLAFELGRASRSQHAGRGLISPACDDVPNQQDGLAVRRPADSTDARDHEREHRSGTAMIAKPPFATEFGSEFMPCPPPGRTGRGHSSGIPALRKPAK